MTIPSTLVVKARSVRILMALAVENGWTVHHIDVNAAYLKADLKEEAYIELPEGLLKFIKRKGGLEVVPNYEELESGCWIIRLKKCMYSLHQSGKTWNETIIEYLISMGLKQCKADPCIYLLLERKGDNSYNLRR